MSDDRVYEGYWYLPERADSKVPGILRLSRTGHPYLELFGWLYPDTAPIPRQPDIILGETKKGFEITLVDCYLIKGPIQRAQQILGSTFGAIEAYLGKHYFDRGKIKTKRVQIAFSKPWLWQLPHPWKPLRLKKVLPDDRRLTREIRLNKSRKICDLPDLSITYTELFRTNGSGATTHYYVQPTLRLQTPKPASLDDFRMPVIALRAFLSLGCRVPIEPTEWWFEGRSRKYLDRWIEIFGASAFGKDEAGEDGLDEHERFVEQADNFFGAKEIIEQHKDALGKWMRELEGLFPVFALFLEGIEGRGKTIDAKVLSLAQAAEVFDGRVSGGSCTYKKRVTNITNACVLPVRKYIGDVDSFAEKVKNIRNYYTHYDSMKSRPSRLFPHSLDDLIDTHKKLRMVLEVNLLLWAGFSRNDVEHYLRNVRAYDDLD